MQVITNVNPDSSEKVIKTLELIEQLKTSIPASIINNMQIHRSALGGGISISFWSNMHSGKIKENSNLHISIMIHFNRGFEFSSVEAHYSSYKISAPAFRGIKKDTDISKCMKKVIDYFNKNEEIFSTNIEYAITEVVV